MINHECINQPYGRILKFSRVQAKEMLTADELKENFAKTARRWRSGQERTALSRAMCIW